MSVLGESNPCRDGDVVSATQPLFSDWLPRDPKSQHRYWKAPEIGDIVQCRFPDFLRHTIDSSQRKSRPAMVVSVSEHANGKTVVQVAYGTSQVEEHQSIYGRKVLGHGLDPGELLVPAAMAQAGLKTDTKFSMRKVVTLPFDNEWFELAPGRAHGQHPKRGSYDRGTMANRLALHTAVREAEDLGSLLQGTGSKVRLKVGSRP